MSTVKAAYVLAQVRSFLNDPEGNFATDAYLLPFLRAAQDEIVLDLAGNAEMPYMADVVIIPDVPAGTMDLSAYFAEGQPLENLDGLISMKERAVDGLRSDQDWSWLLPYRDLPNISPQSFNTVYAWNKQTIKLPGAAQILDLRIYGKFRPANIQDSESTMVPGSQVYLGFETAGLVAMSRQNFQMSDRLMAKATSARQTMTANAIMELQAVRARMRSFSGRNDWR